MVNGCLLRVKKTQNQTETLKETWFLNMVVTYGDGDHGMGMSFEDSEGAET